MAESTYSVFLKPRVAFSLYIRSCSLVRATKRTLCVVQLPVPATEGEWHAARFYSDTKDTHSYDIMQVWYTHTLLCPLAKHVLIA